LTESVSHSRFESLFKLTLFFAAALKLVNAKIYPTLFFWPYQALSDLLYWMSCPLRVDCRADLQIAHQEISHLGWLKA
jgi:hypothetical protein